ncbi:EAL domain-containing protein [Paraglaciecola aquimarina]|uniref:EAL domain-containing protein n=1 Tax=Paraglaciecola aquimarina TaxID=1235557 RepID=A0ABU3T1U5_9ALTE|nr:EAL domain-containing protein [Paraglaciecola aquimarina]MDU0356195.1 EAL domain-containing protein [Paraglaciecola aquimarina]
MNLKNSGIKKALPMLTVIFVLFSLIMFWSFFTLKHINYYHQLNMRHFKHTNELSAFILPSIDMFSVNSPYDLKHLRQTIINIRNQPQECLSITNMTDRLLMYLLDTREIMTICARDVQTANDTLAVLTQYENGNISWQALQNTLTDALANFQNNSNEFEYPLEKTSNFVANITIWLIIFSSIIVLTVTMMISRAVSIVLTKREEAMVALAQSEERNRQLAYVDTLTGLPNRNMLEHTINAAMAKSAPQSKQFAVMFIDLDQFKDVNDTLGHTTGDKLLVEIASRISATVQDKDSVIRFGGDEFIAVTDCFDSVEKAEHVARKIINAVSKPVKLARSETYITTSIGIAYYPQHGNNSTLLLKHADTAMYQAKNAGKNQFQVYDKLHASIQNRKLNLVKQLHHAIRNEEFRLVYQPIVKLSDGTTVGSEALIRWTNNINEVITPDEFIPIAEKSGQIIEIGNWVLQQACQQCKNWHDAGATNHVMAINVSSQQLRTCDFSNKLADILQQLSLPAGCIHIEITENIAITEDPRSVATLHELSKLGVKLLLDDFGTGYSCLSYLKDLPFDILKIDRSFMPANNTITSTIIAMGHELNMEIIAEGIESDLCQTFLNNLDCQYGQGYLFQKPVPADEFDIFKTFHT